MVGNSVQNHNPDFTAPSLFATKVGLNEQFEVSSLSTGSSAKNVLVAHNLFNGQSKNCLNTLDGNLFGFDQDVDVTPTNLGHNMSDDQTCTGYTHVPNLYDTIEHEVADNGGSVPTIKLLPGSPAINAGGQVQGISTDARGVARTGYISVGAYQGELLAGSTNTPSGTLANTGALTISAAVLGLIIILVLLIIYRDYRRYKKPLKAVDPDVHYSFVHHVRVVTIPLFRYRFSIKITKKNSLDSNRKDPDGLHKF